MSLQDKLKWDEKYIKKPSLLKSRPHTQKLQLALSHAQTGKALDIACGIGRNTLFLAKNGFYVDAIDIAQAAINKLNEDAKEQNLSSHINAILADTDEFEIEKNIYDFIIMSNFLDRRLIIEAQNALKKNGIFFIETYMLSDENEKENSDPKNMLKPNELKEMLTDSFELIEYDEFDNESFELYKMKKQAIIAKKVRND
jgi:SAM-dependent methyltransferase